MTSTTPDIEDRVGDLDWAALAWYGQPLARLVAELDLVRVAPGVPAPWLARVPGLASGHVVAVSRDLAGEGGRPAPTAVAGGPCLGDCQSFPTLEALHDTAQVLVAARVLEAAAVIFLGDHEESLSRGGDPRWGKLAERMESWVEALARTLGCTRLCVVRTSSPRHAEVIAPIEASLASLSGEELGRAFHLGSGRVTLRDEAACVVTRRVVAAHHPDAVRAHAGLAGSAGVIIAENLQQAGCHALAARAPHDGLFGYLGHWPAPGASFSDRMYRCGGFEKLPAWELPVVAAGQHSHAHPRTAAFFACWLTPDERAALATVK